MIKNKIECIDFTKKKFNPQKYGKTLQEFIKEMNGIDENGNWLKGMDVFRKTYSKVGWGFLINWTSWPILKTLFDQLYKIFSKVRPKISSFKIKKGEKCA